MGPGTHVGPLGTDRAKVPGHIGRAATRGERAAVRGGKHGPATAVWEQAAIHDVQGVPARLQPVSSLQTDWCHVLHQSWPTSSTSSVVELQTRRELTPVPLVASESHMVSSATRPSESGRSLGNAMPVQRSRGTVAADRLEGTRMPHSEDRTRERGGWSWT